MDNNTDSSSDSFQKRVAIVTGGAMGIGAAIATRLSNAGMAVIVADRDLDAGRRFAASLGGTEGEVTAIQVDVGEPQSVSNAFDLIEREFGRCDILINNAGIGNTYPFSDFPVDYWRLTLDVNLTGPLLLALRASEMMKAKHWGRIINIASVSGIVASAGRTAYGASKAGLIGLTRQMAIELAPYGITANCVAPGPTETPLVQAVHTQETRDSYFRRIPMRRYGKPEEMAGAVIFLASDDASFITGQTLAIDGGFSIAGVLDI
ncbi:SDR family oxidoreductase [Paraburkholderia dipogonis]|uniref:SDR family oxidoreductase n=1 Tax=Paraburkholderia dipogonis TaxID=1211383 RepID=A0A4Y8MK60_9BURK|nr:SDR family NAD(P)-dependent oxidoreductase [Paraburkholderia dipogonis]TFE37832.1 SDR family oxidoreductase [Paraburkholderia dipogonis]